MLNTFSLKSITLYILKQKKGIIRVKINNSKSNELKKYNVYVGKIKNKYKKSKISRL